MKNLLNYIDTDRFIIDIPPAFPSGRPHAGHLYQYSVISNYISLLKELGFTVNYQIGFDRNGLPIFLKAKEALIAANEDLSKENIIKKCEELSSKNISIMTSFFSILGLDTTTIYTTRDNEYVKEVSELIMKMKEYSLKEDYKICRYCLDCNSFLSKNEVSTNSIEVDGYFIKFNYTSSQKIEIYTTKPELLGHAKAIVFNESDERYLHLKNQSIFNPFSKTYIPILTSESVLLEVGTGIQYVASFGSMDDFQILLDLSIKSENHLIDGKLSQGCFKGLSIDDAKMKVDEYLFKYRLEYYKVKKITKRQIHSERSSCKKEIHYLKSLQTFFVVSDDLKVKLLDNIESLKNKEQNILGLCSEEEYNRLTNWVKNYEEWCISRQYIYGNFLNEKGDVLDCWADSSVTIQYLAKKFKNYSKILRFQGSDIVDTWAFFSILSQNIINNGIQLDQIFFTPLIVGDDNKKLSKSSKNYDEQFVNSLTNNENIDILKLWAISVNTEKKIVRLNQVTFSFIKKIINKLQNLIFFFNKEEQEKKEKFIISEEYKKFNILFIKTIDKIYKNLSNPLGEISRFIIIFSNKLIYLDEIILSKHEKIEILNKILCLLSCFAPNLKIFVKKNYNKTLKELKEYYLESYNLLDISIR